MAEFNSVLGLTKYEALSNDYLVLDDPDRFELGLRLAQRLCDRHRGVGSDGLLLIDPTARVVRIVNPDGSEAEKSGNGLRIAAAHLVLTGRAGAEFSLRTPAGEAPVRVLTVGEAEVTAAIGLGTPRVGGLERIDGLGVEGFPVDVGNPHFVVVGEPVSEARARELGPRVESHARFRERTNVQLMEPAPAGIRIEIWERGAGYTLASGTSAAAAAAAAMAAGLAGDDVEVAMPGGTLQVRRQADGSLVQTGPARRVFLAQVAPADLA